MGIRENKLLLKQLHETGYPGGPKALDRFFAPEYAAHVAWRNLEGLKDTLQAFAEAFPNAEWVVEDMVGEGDKVAVRCLVKIRTAAGIVRSVGSTTIYRLANNRIVEQWGHGDALF